MVILVDADSCPVKEILLEIGEKYNIRVIFLASINHNIEVNKFGEVKIVDAYNQGVDIELANLASNRDIVVTNDYGLASIVLGKGCFVISASGYIFTKENIDSLLLSRHISMKLRKSGYRVKGPRKRNNRYTLCKRYATFCFYKRRSV